MERKGRHFVFLLPSLAGVLLFYVLPFGAILWYSICSGSGSFVGFENYGNLLGNDAFLLGAKNTFLILTPAVVLVVFLSLALALLLERCIPLRSQLRTAFLSPMMVPVASIVLVWQLLFQQNGGVNLLLSLDTDWFHSDSSRWMVILLYLWKNIGCNTILFTAALASIPKDVVQMAALDGANEMRMFFSIKLPYLSSGIVFVLVMSLISGMKIFREVYLLVGAYPYESLYLLQHFMNNTFHSMDYQKLCTAAMVLTTVIGSGIWLLLRIEQHLGKDVENE